MGRVIAAKLAADGFDVAVAYAGDIDLADAAVSEIKAQGRRGAAFAADIADAEAVSALFDAVDDRFGHLDVVSIPPGSITLSPSSTLTWLTLTRSTGSTCEARSSSTSRPRGGFVTAARSSTSRRAWCGSRHRL